MSDEVSFIEAIDRCYSSGIITDEDRKIIETATAVEKDKFRTKFLELCYYLFGSTNYQTDRAIALFGWLKTNFTINIVKEI